MDAGQSDTLKVSGGLGEPLGSGTIALPGMLLYLSTEVLLVCGGEGGSCIISHALKERSVTIILSAVEAESETSWGSLA